MSADYLETVHLAGTLGNILPQITKQHIGTQTKIYLSCLTKTS